MGLDMDFEAKKEVYHLFTCHDAAEGRIDLTDYPEDLKVLGDYIFQQNFKYSVMEERYQIGYFRKFNALHGYIVDHFANGVDDCRPIELSKKDITQLLAVCKSVKEHPNQAKELLPTQTGPFFGDVDYDDWYFNAVDAAIDLFTRILEILDFTKYRVIYRASW